MASTSKCPCKERGSNGGYTHSGTLTHFGVGGSYYLWVCANHYDNYKNAGYTPASAKPKLIKPKRPLSLTPMKWKCRKCKYQHHTGEIVCKCCGVTRVFKDKRKAKQVALATKEAIAMQWWQILDQLSQASARIMLVGPPGTGKSQTAFLLLSKGSTAQRLTMTEGTAVEDLLGMFHLVEGSTVWKDGPAARAMRGGTALILDEIDKYSPEVGSLLYALLDDDPQVTLPSGEHLKAKAGYKVIATSNANVSALPEAILDRMEAVIIAAKPHPDAMAHLRDEEKAAVISHYEKKVDEKVWQWTGTATLRRMRAYHKFRHELKELPETVAAEAAFGKNGKEIISVLATAARRKEGL